MPQSSSVLMVCFLQLIPGMGTGILFSLLTSEALQSIPQQKRSTAMGFFQAVYAVGMTTFPIISGSVYEHVSMKAAFIFLAGTCFIAFIISLVFSRKKARKSHKRNVS